MSLIVEKTKHLLAIAFGLDEKIWNLDYIRHFVGDDYHHKVRRFDRIESKKDTRVSSKKCSVIFDSLSTLRSWKTLA